MQPILAVAWLTWKAAFRFRLFLVIAALLLFSVVALPLLIKDDGTVRGFTQIVLTYTLTTIASLLGMSTLWLACGTLARDIEECQVQVVATKPIARWEIWLGKYLGILSLNAALLALAGGSVYALLHLRAARLPADQQLILHNEVLVARGSAREPAIQKELEREADNQLREQLARAPVSTADVAEARRQILEKLKAEFQILAPNYVRVWEIPLGSARHSLKDRPLYLRFKFNAAQKSPSGTFISQFQIGVPQKTQVWQSDPLSLAPDTFHELELPPNLFDSDGLLTVAALNPNDTALLFSLEEGLEVLYREGGFGLNYARGLGIIFCWMALLAALGLASASLLSFPVAAFFSIGLLSLVFFSSTMRSAVDIGTVGNYDAEHGTKSPNPADVVLIPTFKVVLWTIDRLADYSPVDALSTGRSIGWAMLGRAFAWIVLVAGGFISLVGILIFTRRELAAAQGTH